MFVTGVCTTLDVDALLFHMNNARYLRELDFARVDFYERTGLLRVIQATQGKVFQGASTIRYRRFIRPFAIYHITSKVTYLTFINFAKRIKKTFRFYVHLQFLSRLNLI